MKSYERAIARAIRIEKESETGALYIVFEVIDESFKKDLEKDWLADIEVKLVGKELFKKG